MLEKTQRATSFDALSPAQSFRTPPMCAPVRACVRACAPVRVQPRLWGLEVPAEGGRPLSATPRSGLRGSAPGSCALRGLITDGTRNSMKEVPEIGK